MGNFFYRPKNSALKKRSFHQKVRAGVLNRANYWLAMSFKSWLFERFLKAVDKCGSFPREGVNVIKLRDSSPSLRSREGVVERSPEASGGVSQPGLIGANLAHIVNSPRRASPTPLSAAQREGATETTN